MPPDNELECFERWLKPQEWRPWSSWKAWQKEVIHSSNTIHLTFTHCGSSRWGFRLGSSLARPAGRSCSSSSVTISNSSSILPCDKGKDNSISQWNECVFGSNSQLVSSFLWNPRLLLATSLLLVSSQKDFAHVAFACETLACETFAFLPL